MNDQLHPNTDDEILSAFIDNELPADEVARLRERLEREPLLAARLQELEHAGSRIAGAYSDALEEPLPASVLQLLAPDDGKVVEFEPRGSGPARQGRTALALPLSLAAGIALVIGVLVGTIVGSQGPATGGEALLARAGIVEPGTALFDVLESVPSAETRTLGADVTATPSMSFQTRDGDFCRQLDVASEDGTTEALACLRAGSWRVEVAAFAAVPTDASGGAYRPAAGGTPVRAAVDEMIEGRPLEAEAERRLIDSGWIDSP